MCEQGISFCCKRIFDHTTNAKHQPIYTLPEACGCLTMSKRDIIALADEVVKTKSRHHTRKSTIMVTDKLRFFTDSWVMEDPIGQPGAFGIAYICHRKQYPDTKFVVKQISKAKFYHIDPIERDKILQNMSNEIAVQKTLNHPNICLLYDVYEDRNYIHLVMDYLEGLVCMWYVLCTCV